jgi:anti-sigma factor RsiW
MSAEVFRFDDSAHRTADAALPWLVNGTLDESELAIVERHVRECARCQREVELLRQLQAVCAADEPHYDATPAYRRLHAQISGGRFDPLAGWLHGLLRPWWRAPRWARWAIAAEFAGIVALAVWLAPPPGAGVDSQFRTLGAPTSSSAPVNSIAVVFRSDISESELRHIAEKAGARVIDGPTESSAYLLVVPAGQRDAILAALRADPGVVLAQPLSARPDR